MAGKGPIYIIGIGADGAAGLRPDLLDAIHQADFLAGGERHLRAFAMARGERFVLKNNVAELVLQLTDRYRRQRCVVLASGDPLFHGIAAVLVGRMGPELFCIEPGLSSMQLAFARAGIAWQGAELASIHGRDLRTALLPLLGRPVIGLLTQDGDSPAAVARFFLRYGLDDYEAIVGENLGAVDERVTRWPNLAPLADRRFSNLNYLVLRRTGRVGPAAERSLVPGVPDETFARPTDGPEVMTRQEVRAVVLAKLIGPTQPGDTLWDIGAGLGTVSVEAAVLRPHVEVVAVERDAGRADHLRRNRTRFDAHNVRVIEGEAPEALADERERPWRIFVGGSGTRLAAILDFAAERLRDGGRLVAGFVTLEHLALAHQRLKEWGWPIEITEVQVSRGDALAGLTGLKPQRGVFLVSATKPEMSRG
jgi:precorrin-6Y C5,15-methyltransferase (decarboxylating)